MKKIILLITFLFSIEGFSQCTRMWMFPYQTVYSNNLGGVQIVTEGVSTLEYSEVGGLIVGNDYEFTLKSSQSNHKYITITDWSNTVLGHGFSPLTIENITSSEIRMHYAENSECVSSEDIVNTSTIQNLIDCPAPSDIEIAEINTTTAEFMWSAVAEETAWEVLVLEANATPPTDLTSGIPVEDIPVYVAENLDPGSYYIIYIRGNCGDEFSPWNKMSFSTNCNLLDGLNENFDVIPSSYEYGDLPVCWSKIIFPENSDSATLGTVNYNSNSGEYAVSLYNGNLGNTGNIILVSPELSNLSDGTHRLKFYTKTAYGNAFLEIGTVGSTANNAPFSFLEEVSVNDVYSQKVIDFSLYEGADTHIAIRLKSEQNWTGVFVDDIIWEVSPLCPDVTDISVLNTDIDSALISWDIDGLETNWEIAYAEFTVNDPSGLTPLVTEDNLVNEMTITGLESNTKYKVWIRSVCGENLGAWIGPVVFNTACEAMDLFVEDFESAQNNELPECWSSIIRGESVSSMASVSIVQNSANSGNQCVAFDSWNSGLDSDIILVSPNLSTLNTATHRLKFYARSYNNSSIQVGTLNSSAGSAVFTNVKNVNVTTNYLEYTVDFSDYLGTDTYIGIRHNGGDWSTILIDDIRWESIPDCADVQNISVPFTTLNTATITWSPGDAEQEWDLVYTSGSVSNPNTLTPINLTVGADTEYIINELSPNTSYKVWVRSVCGEDLGAWMGPVYFSTPCSPTDFFIEDFEQTAMEEIPACWSSILRGPSLSSFAGVYVLDFQPIGGLKSMTLSNGVSGPGTDIILVTPYLENLTATPHRLKFKASANSSSKVQVGTINVANSSGVFDFIEEFQVNSSNQEFTIDFTDYEGVDRFIAFRHSNDDSFQTIILDDIRWEEVPLCSDVTQIQVPQITENTATVTWNTSGTETQWQVAYGLATITNPNTITPVPSFQTEINIDELQDNTLYKVWVRSVCGDNFGAWIGAVTFRTSCLSVSDLNEGFENYAQGSLPDCWSKIIRGEDVSFSYIEVAEYNGYSGVNSVILRNSSSDFDDEVILVSPNLGATLSAATHQLRFHAYSYNSSSIAVGTLDYNNDFAVFNNQQQVALSDNYTEYIFEFPTATIEDKYIGIRHIAQPGNYTEVYIDNVVWETNLNLDNFKNSSLKYFPNPVNDILNITDENIISQIEVYNLLGQKLMHTQTDSNAVQVNISNLSSGTYLLKIKVGETLKSIKIIKK